MATINIYKIDDDKIESFFGDITDKFSEIGDIDFTITQNEETYDFSMLLFYDDEDNDEENQIKWKWIIDCFNSEEDATTKKSPRGIVSIEVNGNVYAVSFSYAYFFIDKYCDREFPFDFGRRIDFNNIKTTALTNPNLQRNKTVSTFIDYNNINFESGEALTKLKANINLPETFDLFKSSIEIGNSIKFSTENPTLEKIGEIIIYVENIIENANIRNKIPTFNRIKDEELVNTLTQDFLEGIENEVIEIEFSEYQVHATHTIFSRSDQYKILYNRNGDFVDNISIEEIREYSNNHNINIKDLVEKGKIQVYSDGGSVYTLSILERAFYTNEENNAVFQDGKWYKYNNDYIEYMNSSIAEIEVINNNDFDFSKSAYNQYLLEKYNELRYNDEYTNMDEDEIKKKIKHKYYKEYYFNDNLTNYGYVNFDRELEILDAHKYEVMDSYKDNCMYTVKIGSGSAKLCYAIDQSILALELYKKNKIENLTGINEISLWLILDRRTRLPIVNGKIQLNNLKMIILKNKLDYWKKEVRLKGFNPKICINYIVD